MLHHGLDDLIVGTREAKSYIVFGKQDTNTIELSIIAADSPLITKPPLPAAMADNSMVSASCLPNTIYDFWHKYWWLCY
jgi:hypothetical protein